MLKGVPKSKATESRKDQTVKESAKGTRGKRTPTSSPTSTAASPSPGGSELGFGDSMASHEHNVLKLVTLEEVLSESDTPKSPEKLGTENDDLDLPVKKKRKKTARLVLSDEQELELVDWLQAHPELFDKGTKKYKDIELKNTLWEEKASELGVESGELLHMWYSSMRTRFGKLKKLKSADECKEFTSRDQWILQHFAFISPHIYACPNRRGASLKRKLQSKPTRSYQPTPQPDSASEDDDDEEDAYFIPAVHRSSTPPMVPSTSATFPSTFATTSSTSSSAPASLNPLHQASVSALLSSQQNDSMAKGYGTFLSMFVPSLHPSLLTEFYQESWDMVMRYHMQSDRLKEEERQKAGLLAHNHMM